MPQTSAPAVPIDSGSTDSANLLARIEAAKQENTLPHYLAIEGPIGVGKTTLARKLADLLNYPLMLEPVTDNPFLDRFYAEGASQALPTQLFFFCIGHGRSQTCPAMIFLIACWSPTS